ncbi:hypothetical protein [Stutzerimonas balearica]
MPAFAWLPRRWPRHGGTVRRQAR